MSYRTLVLVCSFLLLGQISKGQWALQDIDFDVDVLFGLDFINSDVGFAVGAEGAILSTYDGGSNWNYSTQTTLDLLNVEFITDSIGYILGRNGVIRYTNDQGATWIPQDSPSGSMDLRQMSFVNETKGWIVGQYKTLLKTEDGGNTWIDMAYTLGNSVSNTTSFYDVVFLSDSIGIVLGSLAWPDYNSVLRKTTDGGNSWSPILVTPAPDYSQRLFFINDSIGWLCGYNGMIQKTIDAGENWVIQDTYVFNNLYDIHFIDSNNGWVSGENGRMLSTTDGGENWLPSNTPTPHRLFNVDFINLEEGWVVGDYETILRYPGPPIIINGIDENSLEKSFSIHPNPIFDYATVNINVQSTEVELIIYNSKGERISGKHLSKIDELTYRFVRNELSAGVYIIQLITEGHSVSKSLSIVD